MKLLLTGCSHHESALAARERLAFSPEQTRQALGIFGQRFPDAEAVLLSTCNRTEVYTAASDSAAAPSHEQVAGFLAEFHGVPPAEVVDDLFERAGEDAVRHLFTVASSLDSMVVGEPQILAQVKQAYQLATEHDRVGPLTNSIFQEAVHVARRITTETSIHQHRLSLPAIAIAQFAREIFSRFDDKQVLIIGAGEMAEETLRYLRDEGARHLTVVNRNPDRARRLADEWHGRAVDWDQRLAHLATADLVITTTGATEPIISLDDFRRVEPHRFQKPLFLLDLAVPRDVDPAVGDCLGVYLYSIDDLQTACKENTARRQQELPRAHAIIEAETNRFMAELRHRATGPVIRRLKQHWQQPKDEELSRLFNKLPELDDRGRREVAQSFDRLVNKLLHPPLESLRDESRHGTPSALLEALKRLFQLHD